MPVQQIAVLPARETASNGKSTPHSKDKNEGKKVPGGSGSRSSNISKASNSTTVPIAASRTSITTSSQDICSSGQLTRLEEDVSVLYKHGKHTAVMTINSMALDSSSRSQKKQVKQRHRHKKKNCTGFDCVEKNTTQTDRSDLSSDRSEVRTQSFMSWRELPPRLCRSGAFHSDSSSEDEVWCEARSWSKEKARRARRRSEGSRERDGANVEKGQERRTEITEIIELQSMGSSKGMEDDALVKENGSLKKRHSSKSSVKNDDHKLQREGDKEGYKSGGSSSVGEDGVERITKCYQEKVSYSENRSVHSPQAHCGMNGGTVRLYSESELEVCRICHCEGDEECPLIMPCRCTGSLSFVHQACLNQWIKSSDRRCCELCKYDFIMETKLKPLRKVHKWQPLHKRVSSSQRPHNSLCCPQWKRLHMSKSEWRKILCSVLFHLIAIVCMLWSVYILVKRTAEEIRLGKNGILEWPFWTKFIVVGIGFTGGLFFMYIQGKVYLQLWRRLKAFNCIISVQNCPEKNHPPPCQARPSVPMNGKVDPVVVPVIAAPAPASEALMDSDQSVEAAVAPVQNPI